MNIKKAIILMSAAMLIASPLVFSTPAEAKDGKKSHKSGHSYNHGGRHNSGRHNGGHHNSNRGHHNRGHSGGHRNYGHNRHNYGHDRHYYGHDHYPRDYYYDSGYGFGAVWPYGLSIYYRH